MPPELDRRPDEPELWQSIEQWMDSAQFREMMRDEFPEDASEWLDPVSRRKFLTLMGASFALAGAVGCNPSLRPASQRQVVPYVTQPTEIVPGVPLFFATAMPQAGGVGVGLIAKSVEGRPIKIEGNPNHPTSLGGTNVFAQASVLGMYDPDRSKETTHRGVSSSFEKAIATIKAELDRQNAAKGGGIRILSEPITSPTLARLVNEFLTRYPSAKWVQYEAVGNENARKAAVAALGKPVNAVTHLEKAKVILSVDCDYLAAATPGDIPAARATMAKRRVREVHANLDAGDGVAVDAKAMNRVYAVESMVTNTGGVADHRLPLKPSEIEGFLRAVARAAGVQGVPDAGALSGTAAKWVQPLADDLKNAGVVLVGDTQPPAVHVLAHAINNQIGAYRDGIVTFTEPLEARPSADPMADFKTLVDDMKGGKVDLLLVLGVNPVFDAPADLEFVQALDGVKGLTVHHGLYQDETGSLCRWHLNAAHYLEAWGDVRGHDGTVAIQQPLIAPIHNGRSVIDLLTTLLDLGTGGLEVVQETWKKHAGESADYEAWWQRALKAGVVPNTALPAAAVTFNPAALTNPALASPAPKGGTEIQFRPDLGIWDGRYANIGWLQELPRPVTKLTWDNAAIVSPKTAADLGVAIDFAWTGGENGRSNANVVELTLDGRKLKAAVWILPGHADGVVTLHLGHGRERSGKIGTRTGFNAYQLRTTANMWTAGGLTVNKTGEQYVLACTQGQYAMEGRRPFRHATVEQFKKEENHEFAKVPAATPAEFREIDQLVPGTPAEWERLHGDSRKYPIDIHSHGEHPPHDPRIIPLSLYPKYPQKVDGQEASKDYRRWGMVIDLGACTGCSTCIVACQSENNIPVVGKEQVSRGRAMHWLRIDRYFSIPGEKVMEDELGDRKTSQNFLRGNAARAEAVKRSEAIRAHFQPMMCVQCEKAPCEIVCPVGATVHSADGLNDMVYNRCVGTRYCSNNCPYKVRRFNFLQYADYTTDSLKLVNNPEVTVRQRGVMEKCTYCVQRIRTAEIQAEREFATRPKDAGGRPKIMDGEVMTACQTACPTNAIAFGDINDPDSRVLRLKAEPHTYGVLAEQNTMPRTSYLAQIRNPNPAMPKGA